MELALDISLGIPSDFSAEDYYPPLPEQEEFLLSGKKHRLARWGRGFGKTLTVWRATTIALFQYPGIRWLYCAPINRTFQDATYPAIEQDRIIWKALTGEDFVKSWNKQVGILRLHNGSSVTFRSATNIDGLRGGTYGGASFEEPGYIDGSSTAWTSFAPTLRGWGPQSIIAGGTLSEFGGMLNVFVELAAQRPDLWYSSIAATEDNPFFPRETLDLLKATLSVAAFDRECKGLDTPSSGIVFPEYVPELNRAPGWDLDAAQKADPSWRTFVLIDWGFNLAHVLWIAARQPDQSKLPEVVVFDDWPLDRHGHVEICDKIIGRMKQLERRVSGIIVDPEDETAVKYCRRTFARYGIKVRYEENPTRRRVKSTVDYVRRLLFTPDGTRSLRITDKVVALDCNRNGGRGVHQSLLNYRLKEHRVGTGDYEGKPVDDNKHTHAMDLLRYFCICMRAFGFRWPYHLPAGSPGGHWMATADE